MDKPLTPEERRNEIGEVIQSLFEGIRSSENKDTQERYSERVQSLIASGYFDQPEQFQNRIIRKLDGVFEQCLVEIYPGASREKIHGLMFLYKHFTYLKQNVQYVIVQKEGHPCCADKSRWLLHRFQDYLIQGTLPDMTIDEKCYWKPHFGTGQEWMVLCEGLFSFYYGNPKQYFESLTTLLHSS